MTQTIDFIRQQIKEHIEDTLAKCNVKLYTETRQSATLPAPCPPTTKKTKQSLFAATFILADIEEFCNELEYAYFIGKNIVALRKMLKNYVDTIGTYIFGYEEVMVIQDRDLLCKTTHFRIVVKLIMNAETI